MAAHDRYRYYVSAFVMRSKTEGVPYDQMNLPFLQRNMPPMLETEEEYDRIYLPMSIHENLILKIHPKTYHIEYQPGTEEWNVHSDHVRNRGMSGMIDIQAERKMGFAQKFGAEGSLVLEKFGAEGAEKLNMEWQEKFGEKEEEGEKVVEGEVGGQCDGADEARVDAAMADV